MTPTADDDDLGGCDARDATHQDAAAAVSAHQVVRTDLSGKTSGDLTHRRQKR
jgi:hypothetical protein